MKINHIFEEGCHATLLKLHENGVATSVRDVYTRGECLTYTR